MATIEKVKKETEAEQIRNYYRNLSFEQLMDLCEKENAVDWLMEELANGTQFLTLKRKFAEKFMPEIVPQKAPKKPSMLEKAKARFNKN